MKKNLAIISLIAVAMAWSLPALAQEPTVPNHSYTGKGNPILPDFHADPEILYSHKTKRYYIYSTTDGTPGWGGWQYYAFSSKKLGKKMEWQNEGVVLDAKSDQISWANGNLWAPAAVEVKQKDGSYKYYLYFSARPNDNGRKQMGVAVSDSPTGPFVDLGHPLLAKNHPGCRGQLIDVDVFIDPVSKKPYLYWGNSFMAGAELEPSMTQIKDETVTVMTPKGGSLKDYAYREAPYVFYRNGLYYFMWSVDDTGAANYHVAYGTSKSPLGPIEVAKDPIVLIQDPQHEIYGTAHNSVIQKPGTDEWYIVYHRINKEYLHNQPGVHREVCIDKMEFNADGTIKRVIPTTGEKDARQKVTAPSKADAVSFAPFPKAGDLYWRKQVPEAMRNDYIRLGDSCVNMPWESIPDEVFAEFRTTGNRTHYEEMSFGIRKQFVCLVMAEIMQGKGRFLPAICRGLHYFMEKEPWWGIPAHYPKAKPERGTQPVDLFNAETSDMLAWTLYMLDKQIDKREKGLCDSVRREIDRRFLHPTLYEKQGWKQNANNWNTWITANWLQTVLICGQAQKKGADRLDDDSKAAFEGVKQCLRTFLKGYPDDGGCEEGVGYWDCAGASFFESLFFMQFAPEEARLSLDAAQRKKVEAMGKFITTMYIDSLNFVNFSDAQAHNVPNINILFPYGEYFGNEPMKQLAAYVGKTFDYLHKPSTLFLRSGNYPKLGRELMLLSMLDKYQATEPVQPHTKDAYLENSQIMVASNQDWFLAAKGGNNAESHNHNDVGNFIVYHQQKPVVIDLGRDTYTSQSFSNRRFELMNCRSAYHNVPMINGLEQKDGKQYRAGQVSHVATEQQSSFCLNLAKAYPDQACVNAWKRTITLDRMKNEVEVTEEYQLDSMKLGGISQEKGSRGHQASDNQIVLITYGKPQLLMKDATSQLSRILLQNGSVGLEYDAQQLSASIEKVKMADGIMKTQWHDNVYRIRLFAKEYAPKAKISYRFVNVR